MSLGQRDTSTQGSLFIAAKDLVHSPGHPFYQRVNKLLSKHGFDRFVEEICAKFYSDSVGRPSLPPGTYFRMQFVGFFEGVESERGIAWKCADSLSLRGFLGIPLDMQTPDHSTLSKIRKRLDVETHLQVFDWMLQLLKDHKMIKGKNLAVDSTTLEANAAMRSLLRTDSGLDYQGFLDELAKSSGIETPTLEDQIRMDRKRKKKMNNDDWDHPHDPDAQITRMKDKSTRMAYKMEHGTDMDTEAIVSVTIHGGSKGDTHSMMDTLADASTRLAHLEMADPKRLVADKGYHSDEVLKVLEAIGVKSFIPSKEQKRNWKGKEKEKLRWKANRRRVKSIAGKKRSRRRSEVGERPFSHLKRSGGLGRLWVKGIDEVYKRVLLMTMGFNLSLVMRKLFGFGKPRCLQSSLRSAAQVLASVLHLISIGAVLKWIRYGERKNQRETFFGVAWAA